MANDIENFACTFLLLDKTVEMIHYMVNLFAEQTEELVQNNNKKNTNILNFKIKIWIHKIKYVVLISLYYLT